jgi:hypothetical protein
MFKSGYQTNTEHTFLTQSTVLTTLTICATSIMFISPPNHVNPLNNAYC